MRYENVLPMLCMCDDREEAEELIRSQFSNQLSTSSLTHLCVNVRNEGWRCVSTLIYSLKSGKFVIIVVWSVSGQTFDEGVREMRNRGFRQKKLQLLCDITGSLRPSILTELMGVSGVGKTTLLDVLCGRKTGGTIEGDIRIRGYPKVQETFARISGYCGQNDIHSPNITVEKSVTFSAWLQLPPKIDALTKSVHVSS
ncbi:hypothetical protein PIB30_076530 [Stylosanthes scabra]|uniref:ABC transporter domain-containing protein n=1 Tax=Stylosanthes scabra TaxID=79078 RepID=A0ABU6XR97_9FABA|nr:hypothetical protein [Stylosanthes scabra]